MKIMQHDRTRIKVCGITRPADARAAVAAGADAVGFIFAEASPRKVTPEAVRDIVASLPPFVDAVGVFVDQDVEYIEELVNYCGLTVVQLHGKESPAVCKRLSVRVLKAFRISADRLAAGLVEYGPYYGNVAGFLLDTYAKGQAGGTGEVFDWQLVEHNRPPGPVILAGGLTPANVSVAVQMVRPFAVDINSGVEEAPGIKDEEAIRRAVEAVRQADAILRQRDREEAHGETQKESAEFGGTSTGC